MCILRPPSPPHLSTSGSMRAGNKIDLKYRCALAFASIADIVTIVRFYVRSRTNGSLGRVGDSMPIRHVNDVLAQNVAVFPLYMYVEHINSDTYVQDQPLLWLGLAKLCTSDAMQACELAKHLCSSQQILPSYILKRQRLRYLYVAFV